MVIFIVYKHTCRLNGKSYVGQSSKPSLGIDDPQKLLKVRWQGHCAAARYGSKLIFHRAIMKYGKESFDYEVLEICNSLEHVLEREVFWIDKLNTFGSGYNLTCGGQYCVVTDEIREKMRKAGREVMARPEVLKKKSKRVAQIEPSTGEIVAVYSSVRNAYRQTGINHGNICSCAREKGKNVIGGFKWNFVDDSVTVTKQNMNTQAIDARHKGEKCHQTKFYESDVIEMRAKYDLLDRSLRGVVMALCSDYAMRYGVTSKAIFNAVTHRTWKHIP